MELEGSILHLQVLSSNLHPEPNQFLIFFLVLLLSSNLCLDLPRCLFPVGLTVKIVKALLPPSILATCPAHLNLVDFITLTILNWRYKLWSNFGTSVFRSMLQKISICLMPVYMSREEREEFVLGSETVSRGASMAQVNISLPTLHGSD